jgi:tetratricopeptide (TPR) repeat protein
VVGELKTQLLESEKRTLEKKPTENTEAYSNFLRGRELYREFTETSAKRALVLFEKTIELDPKFARAHVGVAVCHQYLATSGYELWDVSMATVKSSLGRAIELDPDLAEAHAALSEMYYNQDRIQEAEAEARRALELNPSLPDPHQLLSELAGGEEDREEMVREAEAAYRLDPIRPRFIAFLGTAYLYTGREQEALDFWKKTEQLAPAGSYRGMMEYHLIKGDVEKAKEFHARFVKVEPNHPFGIWIGGVIAALEGDKEKAMVTIRRIEDAKMGAISFNHIAYIYHALGDLDSYFEYLNKALEAHTISPVPMMYSPLFAKARTDPRYSGIVERIRNPLGPTK